ncbi:hypothetical protein AB1Y20_010395 [Prymnesium parvum]|uniref:DNA-directed DNA polymerase n=1 Tax=Prymnesium parvum TaxID=97485 RepID=A0AB34IR99_PRYPA
MHSLALLKHLRDSGSLNAIDATTRGIFMTQYHDRLSRAEYITLEYPPEAVRPTHPERSYSRLFGRGEDIDDDVEAMKDILQVDELDETQIKALKNAMKLHEQYAALPAHMRTKLDDKMLANRFTLDDQLATMRRAIPPSAVVFFDFESSPFGEHTPYGVCYGDYNQDTVHTIRGEDCAEALMDELLEVYGCDCPDDVDWGEFNPPVIKLMAHNATYDYSFLFKHLRRVKFLEKGTSLICGTALVSNEYMRTTESPNAQLVRWMIEDAWEMVERDNNIRPQWRRCLQHLRKTSTFVTVDNLHIISHGAKNVVAFLRENAPFNELEPEMIAKRTYRALSIALQDTYKMISMPLSQFGKSFNLPQGKEVMPHALMTKEFVAGGGVATLDEIRKAVCEMYLSENDLVDKLTRLVADHGGVEAVRKLGCRVHATVVDGDSELWLKIDFKYAPDDLGLCLDELHAKKAHLAAYRLIIEHCGNDNALRSLVYEDLLDHVILKAREYDCEVSPGRYDMIEYSMHYCTIDVQVLKDGWRVFHDLLFDKFALSTFHFPTLAGLADRYFIDEGCFEGVCEVSGVVQSFIAQCSVGGRVMCAHNKRSHVKGKIADFDGVSLYPSSMDRLGRQYGGYLTGHPKVWDASVDLGAVDGYFLKIRVTKVGRAFAFPIVRIKTDEGGCDWTNDLEGRDIFVDRFTLEDLVSHSKVEYTILQGYYYDSGRNNKIASVIRTMFNERLRIKKEDKTNPLQLIIKLMMNSGYGKCDTDSMHMDYADVNRLADEFQSRYGRTLIGKQLGQFHVDFEFDGSVGEIHSKEAVFIGKKTYIDVLRDEAGNKAYHIRCKGIPSKCVDHAVITNYNLNTLHSISPPDNVKKYNST